MKFINYGKVCTYGVCTRMQNPQRGTLLKLKNKGKWQWEIYMNFHWLQHRPPNPVRPGS